MLIPTKKKVGKFISMTRNKESEKVLSFRTLIRNLENKKPDADLLQRWTSSVLPS
jgi:hypothetical protein